MHKYAQQYTKMKGHIPGPRASPGPGPARAGPQPRQAAAPTVPLRARSLRPLGVSAFSIGFT